MAKGNAPKAEAKNSSGIAWLIIGAAVAILAVYVLRAGIFGGTGEHIRGGIPSAQRRAVPAVTLPPARPSGSSLDLASLKGEVVVLHFWATWCPPCRAEFPEFAKFAAKAEGEKGVVVVPVSVDNSTAPVGQFLAGVKGKFPVYMNSGNLASDLGVSAIPTTILLDKKGRVAWVARGASDWSAGGVPTVVKELVNG
jgi:thiol-disulfide isomerase/thioredoxin